MFIYAMHNVDWKVQRNSVLHRTAPVKVYIRGW